MNPTPLFLAFFKSEKAAGIVLIFITLISLLCANSFFGDSYVQFFHTKFLGKDLEFWVNDVLMSFFFLLIGLELEREVYEGELSNPKEVLLPLFAAIGGMLIPALIYFGFNSNNDFTGGFGIPMATDIAFAIAVLSLLGKRVPNALKVFLIALAIFDDLGAILIIALVYSKTLSFKFLLVALIIYIALIICNKKKVHNVYPYLIGGVIMWLCIYKSGIHPTIAGVLLAFVIPFKATGKVSCSHKLEKGLHKPVAFFVLPIFALVNCAIPLESNIMAVISTPYSIGIMLGLVLGKPLGIILFSEIGRVFKLYSYNAELNLKSISGAGLLAGIGFTMSIFITLLAFEDVFVQNNAKVAIILASVLSGVLGFLLLRYAIKR